MAGLSASLAAAGQKPEDIRKKFPGQEAVLLNTSTQYKISVKNGEPYVESRENEQLMFLSANAASYLGRYGFSNSHFHEVTEFEAFTKTADNKKVKVTNFKTSDRQSGSVFYDDVKETSFDFPAIGPGAIGTLNQKIIHRKAYLLSPHYFGSSVPIVHNELLISFPKDMSVKYVVKGLNPEKVLFSQDKRGGEITYKFEMNDVEALQRYPDAPEAPYYIPHVVFYIEKYKNEKGAEVDYLSDTNALYRLNSSFIKDINKEAGPELKRIVDSLTKGVSSQEQKARNIYQWVQTHIKYVAFEHGMEGFIPRDANFVCDRRYGDCKDMSSILTLMLNTAGVPAYYTWIGTRSLPYSYRETPLPMVSNHMICAIQLKKDEFIFLDGTDPTCVFGLPPAGIQEKEAMIGLGPDQYRIVTVPSIKKEISVKTDSCFLQITEKGITGRIRQELTGYFAMNTNGTLSYINEKDKERYMKGKLSRGSNKFNLIDYQVADKISNDRVTLTAKFELQDYARKLGDEWYLNLNLHKLYEHQEIDYPKRKSPIDLDFRYIHRYVIQLTIPEGYKVNNLPKSKSFRNDIWGFSMNYSQQGNIVTLAQEFYNDHLLLQPDQFKAWNEVLEHLFPLYKESIYISKK